MLAFSTRKRPVGRERDARAAIDDRLTYLSDGLFKRVYVSPDGATVYKVPKYGNGYSQTAHQIAAEAAYAAAGRARGVRGIPHVSVYIIDGRQVLAMPFYPGESSDHRAEFGTPDYQREYERDHAIIREWIGFGLSDLHNDNWRRDRRGRPVVTDLAGWANSYPTEYIPESLIPTEEDELMAAGDYPSECDCDDCRRPHAQCDCGTGYTYECTGGDCLRPTAERTCETRAAHCHGPARHHGARLTARMAAHGMPNVTCGRPSLHTPIPTPAVPVAPGQLGLGILFVRAGVPFVD